MNTTSPPQTALVTGADGFIGSHLCELLVQQGYKVKALAQYNSFNHWGWLDEVACKNELEVVCGDVRDPHYCRHITQNVDVVFHLAALIAIPYSYVAPDSYVDTNVKGTLNICQAAMDNGVKRVISTSTEGFSRVGVELRLEVDAQAAATAEEKTQLDAEIVSWQRDVKAAEDVAAAFDERLRAATLELAALEAALVKLGRELSASAATLARTIDAATR
jgi:nucleoside-diphosphate-sugar epimerase